MPPAYDDPPTSSSGPSLRAFMDGGQYPGLPGTAFLFRRAGQIVGYATVYRGDDVLYQGFTGVAPAYRRQGIALALKALVFRFACEEGCRFMETGNRSNNPSILLLNQSLGFRQIGAEIRLWKQLGGTG